MLTFIVLYSNFKFVFLYEVLVRGVGGSRLGAVEQVRVVAALSQLHQDILQSHLLSFTRAVHNVNVLHQDLGVPLPLHFGKV